jgi:hypothetical protein
MKKALVVSAALLVLGLAFTASADARCGVGCLNHKVKKLTAGLKKAEEAIAAQGQTIAQQAQALTAANGALARTAKEVTSLFTCLGEIPLSEFGEPKKGIGYVFETAPATTELTTALDLTEEGEEVGAWFIADVCNTGETAAIGAARNVFPAVIGLQR